MTVGRMRRAGINLIKGEEEEFSQPLWQRRTDFLTNHLRAAPLLSNAVKPAAVIKVGTYIFQRSLQNVKILHQLLHALKLLFNYPANVSYVDSASKQDSILRQA